MSRYRIGFPKIRWEKGIPRILIRDSLEKRTKWAARLFSIFCVLISVVSFPWYVAFSFSLLCFAINIALEKVIFFYVNDIYFTQLAVPYDKNKWVMNLFLYHQPPKSEAQEMDEFSIVFNDEEYAVELFKLLQGWSTEVDLKISFIIDEDSYFVYMYPDHDNSRVDKEIERLEKLRLPEKLTNEPFAGFNHLTICQQFPVGDFSLGKFIEHHSESVPFSINAYYSNGNGALKLIESIEPVRVSGYKARIPSELSMDEYEGAHWQFVVQPHRKSLAKHA